MKVHRSALKHGVSSEDAAQAADGGAQVVEIAGQPIHRVHHHRVAVTDEREQRLKLRTVHVLARGMVDEGPVDLDALKLPPRVLIQGADPGVTDLLPAQ